MDKDHTGSYSKYMEDRQAALFEFFRGYFGYFVDKALNVRREDSPEQ